MLRHLGIPLTGTVTRVARELAAITCAALGHKKSSETNALKEDNPS